VFTKEAITWQGRAILVPHTGGVNEIPPQPHLGGQPAVLREDPVEGTPCGQAADAVVLEYHLHLILHTK